MKRLLFILTIITMCLSCRTLRETEYVYQVKYDSIYQIKYKVDSVIYKDTFLLKGDTIKEIHWRTVINNRTDTIYKTSNDSIYIDKTKIKEVPYKSGWQTFCNICTIIFIILIIVVILFYLFRRLVNIYFHR